MFLKQCLNYDKSNPGGENGGNAWTEDPKQFQDIGCISCYSNYNSLLIVNDATENYVDTISKLMAEQYIFIFDRWSSLRSFNKVILLSLNKV